jgi:prephenate dehydrogenase
MQPRRLAILGVGLLGGSIGLAVRSRLSGCKVAGYGHRRPALEAAIKMGAIDEAYEEPARAVREADCVILCTPVGRLTSLLNEIGPHLSPGTLVTDVGSTKRAVVSAAENTLPLGVHFVGSHPMAGSEKRGVEFAKADLFDKAVCITTPTPRTDPQALSLVESLWQTLGMRTTRLSPEEHDRILADVSHLPHVLAAALVEMQEDAAFALCGKGFLDMTRIAGGDPGLWRDIFLDNRENVRQSLARLRAILKAFDQMLDTGTGEQLEAWLRSAAERRERMLQRRNDSP